ncbi:MAG TPA: cation/H(+) antiporter [Treponema sp.]|nr:cation/H(+) antiporter [Treponema sp.]
MNVVTGLALLLFAGFAMAKIMHLFRLPNVTGYILSGILIGPFCLHLIPQTIIDGMDFVSDIALAFIAFGVGKYLKLSSLRESGSRIIFLTFCEALVAAAAVSILMIFAFHLPVSFALILGATGSATAPASTIMTIRQYKAKGTFVTTLLQVVALDDAVALIAFSLCTAVAQTLNSGVRLNPGVFLYPIALNLLMIVTSGLFGWIFCKIITEKSSNFDRLILALLCILLITGICDSLDVSPLLSCMAFGTVYANKNHDKKMFRQINSFAQPFFILFFVHSGMSLDITSLRTAGIIGIAYFFVRIIGKYAGAFVGSIATRAPSEIRNYLGLALIPQAGVSIGLAVLGQRILPAAMGSLLSVIILSSSVLYEMIGPASAKLALILAKAIKPEKKDFTLCNKQAKVRS